MRAFAILLALLIATPAVAQVKSERIDATAVTVYRDPYRGRAPIPARGWPGGYALITETRTITVPAGPATIRFEGVSEGMMPETAIVTGLPRGVGEKNRDARLISPAALIDAYLKRRVTIRRTDRATGKVTIGDAVIQSGPGGGVLLTTADGVEALGCSGLPEGLRYSGVPGDLSAKPTLSVTTDSPRAARVTVQLSYLAQGFDWSTDYVARVAPDGKTLDLFAWMTLANGGSQGFARAQTQAVAGGLSKQANARLPSGPEPRLVLRCWPMDNTATHPKWQVPRSPWPDMIDDAQEDDGGANIIVTASRIRGRRGAPPPPPPPPPPVMAAPPPPAMMAAQEELGDLKLYRIPEPVTVAALSRKQVAMIDRKAVPFERVHVGPALQPYGYYPAGAAPLPATLMLRLRNEKKDGLGLPLPSGGVSIFEAAGGRQLLVGESRLADRAVGDEVEIVVGASTDLFVRVTQRIDTPQRSSAPTPISYGIRVTNARDTDQTIEIAVPGRIDTASAPLVERRGVKTWRATVPAHGEATLDVMYKP